MQLHQHQIDVIESARQKMAKGVRNICIVAPTGSGKTVLSGFMAREAAQKGMRVLFLAHRRELILQTSKTFDAFGIEHGIISASIPIKFSPHLPIQIGSIGTVRNRLDTMQTPHLIIADETHHIVASTWSSVRRHFHSAYLIGLTATPERLDGKGLREHFEELILGPECGWLIENGFLSKYKMFAPPTPYSMDKVRTRLGEFHTQDLISVVDKPKVTGNVVEQYLRRAYKKKAIAFCVSIPHSQHLVEQLTLANINAVHIDSNSDQETREQALTLLERGDVDVVSNVGLFGEGLDIKAVECVIDIAPTQSLVNWRQRCGRALRAFPGKDHAIILDLAGNSLRHGLPDDKIEWSLDGRLVREQKNKPPSVRVCKECYTSNKQTAEECIECGTEFEKQYREVDEVEGDLEEVKTPPIVKRREQGRAQSYEELVALGTLRGYKNPRGWAYHVFNSRKNRGY